MFSTTNEQFYHDYQYNPTPIPILNYPNYSTNNHDSSSIIFNFNIFFIVYLFLVTDNYIPYQSSSLLIPSQEPMVSTIKIHINPFFRLHSSNQTNQLSSEIEQKHNSLLSSRNRSRSPPINRQVKISSNKKRQERQYRKAQRKKFIQEKELIFKNRSSFLFTKSKHYPSSPDRWEHKEEKLQRLYKQYSNEDTFKQWKPLLLKDCFELYQHAFDKYYGKSIDNKN